MELGKINTLKILRETDIAYLLTDGEEEVFLHKKEAKRPYLDDEEIDVFLYVDNQGRPTASTQEPLIQLGEVKLLEVVEVGRRYGAFLYYGMVKDLMISYDDLPTNMKKWPQVGDKVFVKMIVKGDKLFGHIVGRKQITDEFPNRRLLVENDTVRAHVMYLLDNGLVAYSEAGDEIFVHSNNYREEYRIGQFVEPKILKLNPSGEYVGTLIEQKEVMLEEDALRIMEYLEEHNDEMPLTDKSTPEQINTVFHMSKSAFKRALGTLYKAKKVELKENKTIKL
jgi:predicted RNA-binding protein (virulence factor B family)